MTQDEALSIMKLGHSVFLTGAPGAGKTHLLNIYLDFLYETGVEVAITASTGIAATHIGGLTIHSWAGIGIKKSLTAQDLDRLSQNEKLYRRFQSTKVLVIDEISMLGAGQFEMVDQVARVLRGSDKPFGGMQVILSGDFFQLPPVAKGDDDDRYAFQSQLWKELKPVVCYLESSHRHKDDVVKNFLDGMRRGEVSVDSMNALRARMVDGTKRILENVTRLHTHNVDVDAENDTRLSEIEDEEFVFEMQSRGKKALVNSLKSWCLAPESLRLKKGAQVMFVKNDPNRQFVNGTRGTVLDIEGGLPVVETLSGQKIVADYASWVMDKDGKAVAEISQVPLRLAWAITVHKSQGMTMDEAHIDLSKAFALGQGYVALSRVRSFSGLYLSGFNETALMVDSRVAEADREFKTRSEAASKRLKELNREDIDLKTKEFVERSGGEMVEENADEKKGRRAKPGAKRFAEDVPKESTFEKTRELVAKKLLLDMIARERGVKEKTIIGHLERFLLNGEDISLSYLMPFVRHKVKGYKKIQEAFRETGKFELSPAKKLLEGKGMKVSFDDLRLVRLMLPAEEFRALKKNSSKS
jgi:hypothetical protein